MEFSQHAVDALLRRVFVFVETGRWWLLDRRRASRRAWVHINLILEKADVSCNPGAPLLRQAQDIESSLESTRLRDHLSRWYALRRIFPEQRVPASGKTTVPAVVANVLLVAFALMILDVWGGVRGEVSHKRIGSFVAFFREHAGIVMWLLPILASEASRLIGRRFHDRSLYVRPVAVGAISIRLVELSYWNLAGSTILIDLLLFLSAAAGVVVAWRSSLEAGAEPYSEEAQGFLSFLTDTAFSVSWVPNVMRAVDQGRLAELGALSSLRIVRHSDGLAAVYGAIRIFTLHGAQEGLLRVTVNAVYRSGEYEQIDSRVVMERALPTRQLLVLGLVFDSQVADTVSLVDAVTEELERVGGDITDGMASDGFERLAQQAWATLQMQVSDPQLGRLVRVSRSLLDWDTQTLHPRHPQSLASTVRLCALLLEAPRRTSTGIVDCAKEVIERTEVYFVAGAPIEFSSRDGLQAVSDLTLFRSKALFRIGALRGHFDLARLWWAEEEARLSHDGGLVARALKLGIMNQLGWVAIYLREPSSEYFGCVRPNEWAGVEATSGLEHVLEHYDIGRALSQSVTRDSVFRARAKLDALSEPSIEMLKFIRNRHRQELTTLLVALSA